LTIRQRTDEHDLFSKDATIFDAAFAYSNHFGLGIVVVGINVVFMGIACHQLCLFVSWG